MIYVQMEYRPLHLRKSNMQNTLRLRSKIAMATRTYLDTIHGDHLLILRMNVFNIKFL